MEWYDFFIYANAAAIVLAPLYFDPFVASSGELAGRLVSFATVVAATLVVAEGSLSFLGLGVPPPAPSWGGMIAAGRESLYENPALVLVPGVFFFLTVFSLNRVGDWARGRVGRESSL